MTEKRFTSDKVEKGNAILSVRITDSVTDDNYFIMTKEAYEDDIDDIVDCLNEQQATIQSLKERLYDFEKRKIIEESDIDEDVIPKVKLLRAELFGEKYE